MAKEGLAHSKRNKCRIGTFLPGDHANLETITPGLALLLSLIIMNIKICTCENVYEQRMVKNTTKQMRAVELL